MLHQIDFLEPGTFIVPVGERAHFDLSLEQRPRFRPTAPISASSATRLRGHALVESGLRWLLVANRTFERAVEVAQSLGGRAVHFDALGQGLADADLVIVATGAPHIVLHENDLRDAMARRADRPLVVIDLAVPRNVDPAARTIPNVRLYDMDDLSAVVAAHHPIVSPAIAAAGEIVAQEVAEFIAWWRERQAAPLIMHCVRKPKKFARLK